MAPFPTDPAFLHRTERYWFRAIILASICYGIGFGLYLACVNLLISRIIRSNPTQPVTTRARRRWDIFSLVYITLMMACATASILAEGITGEHAYVDFLNSEGGPPMYFYDQTFLNVTTLRAAYLSIVLCNWGANGLMIWRCLIIYRCSLRTRIINTYIYRWVLYMTIPFLLSLASIACGIIVLFQAFSPQYLPVGMRSLNWTVIWASVAVGLMWTLTGMITLKLLLYRKEMRKAVGEKYALNYISIAAMLIESSGILSCFSVAYLVSYAAEAPAMVLLPYVLTQVQVISPLLIVYRMASGRAWTRHAIPGLESLPVSSMQDPTAIPSTMFQPASAVAFTTAAQDSRDTIQLYPAEELVKPVVPKNWEEETLGSSR